MDNSTFTGGVGRGGLNDDNQIRILICWLVSKRQSKLTDSDIIEILTASGLANYFECASAVSDMLERGNIIAAPDGTLSAGASGANIAETLCEDIPLTVRERSLADTDSLLNMKTNIGQHRVEISRIENGYTVRCSIADLGTPVFVMELYAPTQETASLIKQRFIENGAKLYGDALQMLTGPSPADE